MSAAYWQDVRARFATAAEARDWAKAEAVLKRAAGRKDVPPAVLHNLARVLIERGKPQQAIQWLRAAVKADPRYPPSWVELGRCLMARRDFGPAAEAFQRAGALMPQDQDCRRLAGRAALAAGDWQTAARAYSELLRLAPGDEEATVRGYRALCELRSREALALRDRMLADPQLRGQTLNTTIRVSAGRLPLRPVRPA